MSRFPPIGNGSSSYADTLGAYDGSDATTPRSAASSGRGRDEQRSLQEELAKMDAAVEKSRAASPEPEPGAEARKQAPQWSGPVVMKKPARSATKTQVIQPGSPAATAAPPPPPPRTAPVAPPAPTYEMMQHMHSTKPSDADLQHGARRLKRGDLSFSSGRHYAEFRLVKGAPHVLVGVSKPDWESHLSRGASGEVAIDDASDQEGHCFFYVANGRKFPGGQTWEGRRGAKQGDCIGMLVDMHQGSLAVYKNGELLGMMQRAGLAGELCWSAAHRSPLRGLARMISLTVGHVAQGYRAARREDRGPAQPSRRVRRPRRAVALRAGGGGRPAQAAEARPDGGAAASARVVCAERSRAATRKDGGGGSS